jgi:hypothetical protein
MEAVVNGARRAEARRESLPWNAGAEEEEDRLQASTSVHAGPSSSAVGRLARKERADLVPEFVGQTVRGRETTVTGHPESVP